MTSYESYGLLIDYKYCTNCHSCEVACQEEKGLGKGEFGIRVFESPAEPKCGGAMDDAWDWTYLPMPTWRCDLCAERLDAGRKPMCVKHCLAACMYCGPMDELSAKAAELGGKVVIYKPLGMVALDLGTVGPEVVGAADFDPSKYQRERAAVAAGAVDFSSTKREYREVLKPEEIGEAAFALLSVADRLEFLNGEMAKGLTDAEILAELGIDAKALGHYDCVFVAGEFREVPKRNTI